MQNTHYMKEYILSLCAISRTEDLILFITVYISHASIHYFHDFIFISQNKTKAHSPGHLPGELRNPEVAGTFSTPQI